MMAVLVPLGTMSLAWMVLLSLLILAEKNAPEALLFDPGGGQVQDTTLNSPVTGADHRVAIDLAEGFIWKRGDCGQGHFAVAAEGIEMKFVNSDWIRYDFDWNNHA